MPDTHWTAAHIRTILATSATRLAPGSMALEEDEVSVRAACRTGTDALLSAPVGLPAQLPVEVELAIALYAKGNKEAWQRYAAARHTKAQRQGVYHALCQQGSAHLLTGPLTITITRIAPGVLGPTNPVMAAAKAVVDGIADWLTSTLGKGHYYDDDPRLTWQTQQEKRGRGVYAVHIRIVETCAEGVAGS